MLIAFWALNNITAQKILYVYYGRLLDNFWYQTTGNFDKLIEQDSNKNTARIVTSIFLIIKIHIGLTKLFENSSITINYNSKGRLYRKSQSLDWGDDRKIEETVADAEDNENKAKNPWKKNKKQKKEKMRQKHLSKAKKKLA